MSNEKLNLYEKIQLVSQKVKNIEKNLNVGAGQYTYKAVGDQDVTLAVKDAENEFKLISIPFKQELINSEVIRTIKDNNKESLTYVDTIKMTVRIINIENTTEYIDIESFGKGIDSGDKGFGKASTYARKYALLNAYKIATGVDPDNNKSETKDVLKTITDKRVIVENYLNTDLVKLQNMLQHFNVGQLSDLNEKQIETIYETYTKKGIIK